MRRWVGLLWACGVVAACGQGSGGPGSTEGVDSGTGFGKLVHCADDSACAEGLVCLCDVCTVACARDEDCGVLGVEAPLACVGPERGAAFEAQCAARAGQTQPPDGAGLCLAVCDAEQGGACPAPSEGAGRETTAPDQCVEEICVGLPDVGGWGWNGGVEDAGGVLDAGDAGAGDASAGDTGEDEVSCEASSRWEPEAASANQVIVNHLTPFNEIDLTVELDSGEGGALRGRICHVEGVTFVSDGVFVRVAAQGGGASRQVWFEGEMNGPQQRCTDWEPMDTAGAELGAAYTVGVKIVSPEYCADDWTDACEVVGLRCGYCWHELAMGMARTCAP